MNKFEQRFKTFATQKLLEILEDADSYQPIAVEAAKSELSKRNVTEDEIQSVKDKILDKKAKIEKRQKQVKKVEEKAKALGTELFKTVSPIQKEAPTTYRKINLIVISFGLLAIFQLFEKLNLISFMFSSSLAKWDFSMVMYFAPLILLPIGVFLFWKRNKIGWILMGGFFVYNIIMTIGTFLLAWKWNRKEYTHDHSNGGLQIEIHDIGNIFPETNPFIYLLIIAFWGASLWAIHQKDLRDKFQIDDETSLMTIGFSILITRVIMVLT